MDFTRLTNFLETLPKRGVPGCDMMVCHGGQTVYRHWTGDADREAHRPMDGSELYYMYSVSKLVTCTAALTLYEQGRFLMDDPIAAYLPAFGHMQVQQARPDGQFRLVPAEKTITFRHLFTMTSGLDYDLEHPSVQAVVKATDGRAPTVKIAEAIADHPLSFQPGTFFQYGLSHDVLAALVEVMTGERFADYVRRVIFEPCGMAESFYHLPEDKAGRLARQYVFDDAAGRAIPTDNRNEHILGSEYDSGGAGVISSVTDYMRFARMLTRKGLTEEGARILSPGTVELMRTDHLGPRGITNFDWPHFAGYGYGLGVRTMVDRTLSGSIGPVGEFGWAGAAGAYVLIDPENDLTAFYAEHMRNSMEPYIHNRLRNLVYACMAL